MISICLGYLPCEQENADGSALAEAYKNTHGTITVLIIPVKIKASTMISIFLLNEING